MNPSPTTSAPRARRRQAKGWRVLRWLAWGAGAVFGLILLAAALLQIPLVQNWLRPLVNQQLTAALGARTEVAYLYIGLPDYLILKGVHMDDPQGRPVLRAAKLKASLSSFPVSLIWGAPTQELQINEVSLSDADIYLRTKKNGNLNFAYLWQSDSDSATVADSGSTALLAVTVNDLSLDNIHLEYVDSTQAQSSLKTKVGKINYSNVSLTNFDFSAGVRFRSGQDVKIKLRHVSFDEKHSSFRLDKLSADASIALTAENKWRDRDTVPQISVTNFKLKVDSTELVGNVKLSNESLESLGSESQGPQEYKLDLSGHIYLSDVSFFVPDTLPRGPIFDLRLDASGNSRKLLVDEFSVSSPGLFSIGLTGTLRNFLTDAFYHDLRLKNTYFNVANLYEVLPQYIPSDVASLGGVSLEGKSIGFVNDLLLSLRLFGAWGQVEPNVHLVIPHDSLRPVTYNGGIHVRNVNLDSALRMNGVSNKLNAEVSFSGSGIDASSIQANSEITLFNSQLAGYGIDSFHTNVSIDKLVVESELFMADSQGSLGGKLEVDLREEPSFFFVGNLDEFDLRHYGITELPVNFSTILNFNVSGSEVDSVAGYVRMLEPRFQNFISTASYRPGNVVLTCSNTSSERSIKIESSLLRLLMQGQFTFSGFGDQAARIVESTIKDFLGEATGSLPPASTRPTDHEAILVLQVDNLNPLLRFFETGFDLANGTRLDSRLRIRNDEQTASVRLSLPYLTYDDYSIRHASVKIDFYYDSTFHEYDAGSRITADSLIVDDIVVERLNLASSWSHLGIQSGIRLLIDSARNQFNTSVHVFPANGKFTIQVDPDSTYLRLPNNLWKIDPENIITYGTGSLFIDHFRVFNRDDTQSIAIDSDVGLIPGGQLRLNLRNIQLKEIGESLLPGQGLAGRLNADVRVRDLFGDPLLRTDGSLLGFKYGDINYGNIYAKSNWSDANSKLLLKIGLVQRRDTLLALSGTYDPRNKTSPLDFEVISYNLPLNIFQPYLAGSLSNFSGLLLIDALKIKGSLSEPILLGSAYLRGVSFTVDFLKTYYKMDGELTFSKNQIALKKTTLVDQRGQSMRLGGVIRHSFFSSIVLGIEVQQMNNFLVMDTKSEDSDVFFGRAVVRRGAGSISGPIDNLKIDLRIVTGPGTRFSVPISFYRADARLPYVYFTGSESSGRTTLVKNVDFIYDIRLEVEANQDAELRLIFDEKSGEVIQTRGAGTLAIRSNSAGEFSMNGIYELVRGSYLLNLQNVIKKPFVLEKGGTLQWNGDPLEADLSLSAAYRVEALLDTNSVRVPVDVLIKMGGTLLKPDISFGLSIPENYRQGGDLFIASRIRAIESDPQELNRQVFALLVSSQLLPSGDIGGAGIASGGAASSVAQLLSSQLSNFLSKATGDENLSVGVTTDDFSSVNLAVKAGFFNNRLTVERNGALVSGQGNRDLSIGNITASYRFLPSDSVLRLTANPGVLTGEIFNKENLGFGNTITSINRGVGIFYRKDFDSFSELLPRRQKSSITNSVKIVSPITVSDSISTFNSDTIPVKINR